MKKSRLILGGISIFILVAALTVMILEWAIPFKLWTFPLLDFIAIIFLGFGVMTLVLGISRKSPTYLFLSAILLGLAAIYILLQYIAWWIGLVAVVVLWIIFAIVSIMRNGNKTEDIALNKSPEYKNYEQRKAEKEEAEKAEEKEELPELKSFK